MGSADRSIIRRARSVLTSVAVGALLAYGVAFIVLWSQLEKRFVFSPVAELLYTPNDAGLEYEDIRFQTSDGLTLHGWFIPGKDPVTEVDRPFTWVWFHGNGGNLGYRVDELALAHHQTGDDIFIFDYRGFGESDGKPSERGTYLDSRAALNHLKSRPGFDSRRMVYLGHSLGAAVAVELSLTQPPSALVLVSPFASVRDMAGLALPFPPAAWLLRNHYDNVARVRKINAPVLVLHGDQDDTVPLSQGRKLYEAANQPKQFQTLEGAGHNDTYEAASEQYCGAIESFLAEIE
ncbi:MAG: alpha/beta hydrolase [Chloroflexi bacterium]|nr:alpha/beta hydrolase [Chloroflexota bacterium]MDA1271328.1 alpha/beta hydrolase [Chloroflexota bacterium]